MLYTHKAKQENQLWVTCMASLQLQGRFCLTAAYQEVGQTGGRPKQPQLLHGFQLTMVRRPDSLLWP